MLLFCRLHRYLVVILGNCSHTVTGPWNYDAIGWGIMVTGPTRHSLDGLCGSLTRRACKTTQYVLLKH